MADHAMSLKHSRHETRKEAKGNVFKSIHATDDGDIIQLGLETRTELVKVVGGVCWKERGHDTHIGAAAIGKDDFKFAKEIEEGVVKGGREALPNEREILMREEAIRPIHFEGNDRGHDVSQPLNTSVKEGEEQQKKKVRKNKC